MIRLKFFVTALFSFTLVKETIAIYGSLHLFNTGQLAEVINDLVTFHHEYKNIEPFQCHVLSINLGSDLQENLYQILDPRHQFLTLNGNLKDFDVDLMRQQLSRESTCVYAIIPYHDPNVEAIQGALEVVHHRRIFLIADQSSGNLQLKPMRTKSFLIEPNLQESGYKIHIFCPSSCRISRFDNVDYWMPSTKFISRKKRHFFARCCFGQTELFGKTLTVSIFGAPPFIEPKVDPVSKKIVALNGIDMELLKIIAVKYRFRVQPKPERTWGNLVNGSWSGTIRSVKDDISALGIGHVSITYDRYQVIDYSSPTYIVEYGHISNKPKVLDPFKNVVKPFENFVWIFTVVMIFISTFTFFIIYTTYCSISDKLPYKLEKVDSPLDFLLFPLSMLVQQDKMRWFDNFPKSSSGSIMVLVWSMGGLVLMLSYVSNLRASLIAVEYEKPIDTVQDILQRDENLWYIEGTSLLENLRTSPIAEIQALYEQVVRKNTFFKFSGGLPAEQLKHVVNTGQGSVITHKLTDLLLREGILKLFGYYPFHFTKQIHITVYAGFVMPKNSGYRDDINFAINGMLEFGIIDYLILRKVPYYVLYGNQNSKVAPVPSALQFITIASSVIFLGVMLFLALIILLLEIRHFKSRNPACHPQKKPPKSHDAPKFFRIKVHETFVY